MSVKVSSGKNWIFRLDWSADGTISLNIDISLILQSVNGSRNHGRLNKRKNWVKNCMFTNQQACKKKWKEIKTENDKITDVSVSYCASPSYLFLWKLVNQNKRWILSFNWTEFSRKEPTHILGKIELWVVLNSTTALLSPAKNSKFLLKPILQKLNMKFIFYIECYGGAKL